MYPLTKDRAKPAVPFGGRYRIIDFVINNFINSGIYKDFQKRSREAALYCADELGWTQIYCDSDGRLQTVEEIHKKVMEAIEDMIQ